MRIVLVFFFLFGQSKEEEKKCSRSAVVWANGISDMINSLINHGIILSYNNYSRSIPSILIHRRRSLFHAPKHVAPFTRSSLSFASSLACLLFGTQKRIMRRQKELLRITDPEIRNERKKKKNIIWKTGWANGPLREQHHTIFC